MNGKAMGRINVPFSALCVGESECTLVFDHPKLAPHVQLCFEGITYQAAVTLNGRLLGPMCPYSYHSFDVSGMLRRKGNRLTVALRDMNLPFGPSEGWENYGGIIRDVYLLMTDSTYIDDVIWRTETAPDYRSAECGVMVRLSGGDGGAEAALYDANGFEVARGTAASRGGAASISLHMDRPVMWSPDFPYLYRLSVRVGDDEVVQKVGVKDFHIEGQRFVLNGKPLYLKGVCRHDMWGRQGHTLTEAQMRRDMTMIKAAGCNFVRLVHYPHHRRVVELADEIGLLVSEEPGLWWSDMHNEDTTRGALDVMARVVGRDRNRVSVAFWLAFNECIFTPEYLNDSVAVCKQLDPTRPVSGANCMNIEMTKELFIQNGFDFYTMHPYGAELNCVNGGKNGLTTMDTILNTLNDKPLVFTEWGGTYVFENPKLFARFQRYMLDAWRNPDGGRVLAGSCYWVWADLHEFGRGEPACLDGILHEGLVDIDRSAYRNLDVFAKLMNGMEFTRELRQGVKLMPLSSGRPEALHAVDVWAKQNKKRQKALYEKLLRDSKQQAGYTNKKERRLVHGPALPQDCTLIGEMPVNIRAGQPLVIGDELAVPVNARASRVHFLGNVSFPYGYPAYGDRGELAAEYVFDYADGTNMRIPLHNGIELTTALGMAGPSRIHPVASGLTPAARYHYDRNWEHYIFNLFTADADPEKVIQRIRIRVIDRKYVLLLYGITLAREDSAAG